MVQLMGKSREGFIHYVQRLEDYIDREKPDILRVEDVAMILGISPNYARAVLKAVASKRGYLYSFGVMYINKERVGDND